MYEPINAEKFVKFGPVLAEIFRMICRFLQSLSKTYRNSEIFGVSGLIFSKIAQNVAKNVPFITSKVELR